MDMAARTDRALLRPSRWIPPLPRLRHRIGGPQLTRRVVVVALVLVAFLASGAVAYDRWLQDRIFPRAFAPVSDGLFRSGQISANLIESVLKDNQIGLVVFLSADKADRADVDAEREACRRLGVKRINLPLRGDGTGDWTRYADAIEATVAARKAGRRVLVHCHTGAQRTGAFVTLYRVLVERGDPAAAYRELLSRGHDPSENPKLLPFVNGHLDLIAAELRRRGVIEHIPAPLPLIQP
jgi:protein tyrosine/serine phosphatase